MTPARIVLLTYPGLFGAAVIDVFSRHAGLKLAGIGLSGRIFKNASHAAGAARMWRRSGWRYATYSFVVTDVAWGILRALRHPRALHGRALALRRIADVNDAGVVAWLRDLAPDYVVSCYFNQIIGPAVRASALRKCINVHPALLPALRGPDPCFRALERGFASTGLTLHLMDDDLDTGPILHQTTVPLAPHQGLLETSLRLWRTGARTAAAWLAAGGHGDPVSQHRQGGEYLGWPSAAEVHAFRRNGGRMGGVGAWLRAMKSVMADRHS